MKLIFYFATLGLALGVLFFQNCAGKKFESQTETDPTVVESMSPPTIMPDCKFNRTGLFEGDTVVAYRSSTVPAGQQCVGETRACQNGRLSGTFQYSYCVPGAPAACILGGITIPHGTPIKAFQSALAPFGQTCDQRSETRICNNGTLTGSYTVTQCSVDRGTDCTLNGVTIPHDSQAKFFKTAVVPYQQSCASEYRQCKNGVLDGTYTFKSCDPAGPDSCTLDGVTVLHTNSWPFYEKRTVPFGQVCPAAVSRSCTNGALSGSAVYSFSSCATLDPVNCTFAGETVRHTADVEAFEVASVPFGVDCATKRQVRHCENGILSGNFTFAKCTPALASACTTTDGDMIESGQSRTLFKSNLVTAPAVCDTAANTESVTCTNAVLSGTARFKNCSVAPVVLLPFVGNPGGSDFAPMQCAAEARGTGLAGGVGDYIERVGLLCSTGLSPTPVGGTTGTAFSLRCPAGLYFAGIGGSYSSFVLESLRVYCAKADGTGGVFTATAGANGFTQFESKCPAGYLVSRLMGRTGSHVDQLRLECARVDSAAGANVDCVGSWQNLGCIDGGMGGKTVMEYNISIPKSGNGVACPNADGDRKQGTGRCSGGIER